MKSISPLGWAGDVADKEAVNAQRNILLIVTTGQRGDALGGAGVWPIQTPHLDRLAGDGLALTAVSPSPADWPGLVSLYSGLHVRQHGVAESRGEMGRGMGWLRRFRDAGYHLAGVGRVGAIAEELHEARVVAEMEETEPLRCEYLRYMHRRGMVDAVLEARERRERSGPFDPVRGFAEPANDVDGYIGQKACEAIERLPTDKPWVMVVGFTGPGNDLAAPVAYLDLVEEKPLKKKYVPAELGRVDAFAELHQPRSVLQSLSGSGAAKIQRDYLARVCMIDCCVGMMRDAVKRHGHADSTWTALSSNRGHLLGERGLFGCTGFVGSGSYVPIWITPPKPMREAVDPNDAAVRENDGLVSGVDLAATLCAIGRVDAPDGCQGVSLLGGLMGETAGHAAVLSEFGKRLLLETAQHKAMFDSETGEVRALFDVFIDESERSNLIGDPRGAAMVDMLRWRLAELLLPMRPVLWN